MAAPKDDCSGTVLCNEFTSEIWKDKHYCTQGNKERKVYMKGLRVIAFVWLALLGLQSLKASMDWGLEGKCIRTADLWVLVAAVQAVVVPVAAPALLDAALVAALELLCLAQLGQLLSLFNWGKHPTNTFLYLLDAPRMKILPLHKCILILVLARQDVFM